CTTWNRIGGLAGQEREAAMPGLLTLEAHVGEHVAVRRNGREAGLAVERDLRAHEPRPRRRSSPSNERNRRSRSEHEPGGECQSPVDPWSRGREARNGGIGRPRRLAQRVRKRGGSREAIGREFGQSPKHRLLEG